jgi:hypothetical protein
MDEWVKCMATAYKYSYTIFCQMAALEPWVLLDIWWASVEALAHRKQTQWQ